MLATRTLLSGTSLPSTRTSSSCQAAVSCTGLVWKHHAGAVVHYVDSKVCKGDANVFLFIYLFLQRSWKLLMILTYLCWYFLKTWNDYSIHNIPPHFVVEICFHRRAVGCNRNLPVVDGQQISRKTQWHFVKSNIISVEHWDIFTTFCL